MKLFLLWILGYGRQVTSMGLNFLPLSSMQSKLFGRMAALYGRMPFRRWWAMYVLHLRSWAQVWSHHQGGRKPLGTWSLMDFTRKVRWIKDRHKTPDSATSSFAGVVSCDGIRIALTYAALLGLSVEEPTFVMHTYCNAYLQAQSSEKLNHLWPWVQDWKWRSYCINSLSIM